MNPYELAILIALLQTPVPVPLGIRLARPHTASERRGNHERLMTREHQRQREGCRLRLNELPNGEPRITQYYTAQLTINVTLTKEEAEALACFLAGAPPRRTALGHAWGAIADALAERAITAE